VSCGTTSEDIFYINLPLYHSAGFLIGMVGGIERGKDSRESLEARVVNDSCDPLLFPGLTLVLRRKFSASQFWDDCRKYNVTVMQYIGETLRYLCNSPKKENEKNHKVRIAIGNGVRSDVWTEFLNRFGDIKVRELYAATEGNIGFINYTSKIGARKYRVSETGLLVGKITRRSPFVGYAGNKQQTEKKRLYDVMEKGDLYFNTGDLLMFDHENFVYFQDRVGDTFRCVEAHWLSLSC
ncbi:hypothetical protein XENOCAPTIV_006472, partial [Xenoophorus captivus]